MTAKPSRNQRQQEGSEQDSSLGTQQLEMNQATAADRSWEQEGDLRLGECQGGPLVGNKPRQQDNDEEDQGTDGFEKLQVAGRAGQSGAGWIIVTDKNPAKKVK